MLKCKQCYLAYMEAARRRGIPVREIDPKELHLLMTAYSNGMYEVVVHAAWVAGVSAVCLCLRALLEIL